MPDIKKNNSIIYNALVKEGYSGIGANEDEFAKLMEKEDNRKIVYDALSKGGYSGFGKDFNEFSSLVYAAPETATSITSQPSRSTPEVGQVEQPARQQDPQAAAAEGRSMFNQMVASRRGTSSLSDAPQATQDYLNRPLTKEDKDKYTGKAGPSMDEMYLGAEQIKQQARNAAEKYQEAVENPKLARFNELIDKAQSTKLMSADEYKEMNDLYSAPEVNPMAQLKAAIARRNFNNSPEGEFARLSQQLTKLDKHSKEYEAVEKAWTETEFYKTKSDGLKNAVAGLAEKTRESLGMDPSLYTTWFKMMMRNPATNPSGVIPDTHVKDTQAATSRMLAEAAKILNDPSKYDDTTWLQRRGRFAKEYGKEMVNPEMWLKSLFQAEDALPLRNVFGKIAEHYGNVDERLLKDDDIDNILDEDEKNLLRAYFMLSEAQTLRPEVADYIQSARSAANSTKFIIEMAISGEALGFNALEKKLYDEGAKKLAATYLAKWAEKQIVWDGTFALAAKAGQAVTKLAGKSLITYATSYPAVLFHPTTWGDFAERMSRPNEDGKYDPDALKEAWDSIRDQQKERWTETLGETVFNEFLGSAVRGLGLAGRKALGNGLAGKMADEAAYRFSEIGDYISSTKPAQFIKKAANSSWGQKVRQIAEATHFDGIGPEIGEEALGAAIDAFRQKSAEPLRDFFTWDNLIMTGESFLPMYIWGGGFSAAGLAASRIKYGHSSKRLENLMKKYGYSDEQVQYIFDQTKGAAPSEISKLLADMGANITNSRFGAAAAVVMDDEQEEIVNAFKDYLRDSVEYNTYDAMREEEEAGQREVLKRELEDNYGHKFYIDADDNNPQRVVRARVNDGKGGLADVFLLDDKPGINGKYYAMYPDGQMGWVGVEDMAPMTDEAGNPVLDNLGRFIPSFQAQTLDAFLSEQVMARRQTETAVDNTNRLLAANATLMESVKQIEDNLKHNGKDGYLVRSDESGAEFRPFDDDGKPGEFVPWAQLAIENGITTADAPIPTAEDEVEAEGESMAQAVISRRNIAELVNLEGENSYTIEQDGKTYRLIYALPGSVDAVEGRITGVFAGPNGERRAFSFAYDDVLNPRFEGEDNGGETGGELVDIDGGPKQVDTDASKLPEGWKVGDKVMFPDEKKALEVVGTESGANNGNAGYVIVRDGDGKYRWLSPEFDIPYVVSYEETKPAEPETDGIPVDEKTGERIYDAPGVSAEDVLDAIVEDFEGNDAYAAKFIVERSDAARSALKKAQDVVAKGEAEKAKIDEWEPKDGEWPGAFKARKDEAKAEVDKRIANAKESLPELERKNELWETLRGVADQFKAEAKERERLQKEIETYGVDTRDFPKEPRSLEEAIAYVLSGFFNGGGRLNYQDVVAVTGLDEDSLRNQGWKYVLSNSGISIDNFVHNVLSGSPEASGYVKDEQDAINKVGEMLQSMSRGDLGALIFKNRLNEALAEKGYVDGLREQQNGTSSETETAEEVVDDLPPAEEETIPAEEAVEEAPEGTAVPEVEEPVAEPAEPETTTAEEDDALLENETQEIRDAVDAVVSGKDAKKREVKSTLPDDFTIGGMDVNSYIRSRYDRFKAPLEKRREEIRKEYVAYRTRVENEARADILRNNPHIKEDNPYLPDYVSEEANKRLKNDEQFNALDAQIKAIDDEIGNYQSRRYNALAAIEEIYESQKPAETPENNAPESSETPGNSVPSQEEGGFQRPVFTLRNSTDQAQARNNFVEAVGRRLIFALQNGTEKPYKSITDLRKEARAWGLDVEDSGATDILLQELVELALVKAARALTEQNGIKSKNAFDQICRLYELQPTIGRRSSERVAMQQYSTPLPMSFVAQMFAYNGEMKEVLEPTAGNGMLVFGIPGEKVHANELDDTRNANLQALGFGLVSKQDATEPFGGKYDAVIANPPFGSHDAVEFDGKQISGLDPIITLRALDAMKDGGKAAIIIGGNVEFADNGAWKTKKAFFSYLYDHYNVKGVVNMAGDLYAKQGTTYPTMMILIDGRRSEEERAAGKVYPPTSENARPMATTQDELYDIVKEILNDNRKTDGNQVLRSEERAGNTANNSGQAGNLFPADSSNESSSYGADGQRGRNDSRAVVQDADGNSISGANEENPRVRVANEGKRSGSEVDARPGTVSGPGGRNGSSGASLQGTDGTAGTDGRGNQPVRDGNAGGIPAESVSGRERGSGVLGLANKPKEQKEKRKVEDKNLPYVQHSSAKSLESVAPASMVEAMDAAIQQIEKENGKTIDEWMVEELGYKDTKELYNALAAEQIDSVAMAIYQMKKGKAMIIGDQTGVGKGRQMAALIRWASLHGKKPIFMTQKAGLFSDIYRDMKAVGSAKLKPLIINAVQKERDKDTGEMKHGDRSGVMLEEDKNGKLVEVYLSPGSKKLNEIIASGKVPAEYDYVVLTYSQLNNGDEQSRQESHNNKPISAKDTAKARYIRSIAADGILLMDESHTAAGEDSNSGAFLQSIMPSVNGVTFASATFAKRASTMPLYAIKSAMSEANVEPKELIDMIKRGGVTLQELMARALTGSGQMVRRERDMSDVKTDWKTIDDPATAKRARENYDRAIKIFNDIIAFQQKYIVPFVQEEGLRVAASMGTTDITSGTENFGVDNPPFVNQTYNFTKQLMLALKVDAIVNEVVKEIKAGRHPVIALENTYESGLDGYNVGDKIEDTSFSAGLLRSLAHIMQYTYTDEDGIKHQEQFSPKDLGAAGEQAYYALQEQIREATKDIFLSPLDGIREKLQEQGYKVGEITGRKTQVVKGEDGYTLQKRTADAKQAVVDFNNGTLDVIIINKSGSTGISLHSSVAFKDQRQRSMIIAQPLGDINDYMQMIGRIDRTGQVHRGYYINLSLPVPAELRFNMMLATKLKSLNANTTTDQEGNAGSVEAPDFLNKYGSQVVIEYLRDHPDVFEKLLDADFKLGGKNNQVTTAEDLEEYQAGEDDAQRVTGRIALLPVAEQEAFYNDIAERYNALIKYLDETGENTLKITTLPLKAKTLARKVATEGRDPNGSNPFAQNSYVERVEVDVLKKPMKADEIRRVRESLLNGKTPQQREEELTTRIETQRQARIASENERYERKKEKLQKDIDKQVSAINAKNIPEADKKAEITRVTNRLVSAADVEAEHNHNIAAINNQHDRLRDRFQQFNYDETYLIHETISGGNLFEGAGVPSLFLGFKVAKDGDNLTPSTSFAVFATHDGRRRIEIKFTDGGVLDEISDYTNLNYWLANKTNLANWDATISNATREERYMLTGNILQAWSDASAGGLLPGRLISYTDIDGNIKDGILMNSTWETGSLRSSGKPIDQAREQIENLPWGDVIESTDGQVEIQKSRNFLLRVPKSKKDGAKYYQDERLVSLVRMGDFYQRRGKFEAEVSSENLPAVLQRLSELGVRVADESAENSWEEIGQPQANNDELRFREDQTAARVRQKEDPKKTIKVYKLMRLGDDGKLYPLFIDSSAGISIGEWYDAESPDLDFLKKIPSGVFLVNPADGSYTSLEDYANEHGFKAGKFPPKDAINEASVNGMRWVKITDTEKGQRRYEGENRKYENIGINGSGSVSTFAMRPGWHAGSLPTMRQIGKGAQRNLRDDSFVWVEGEVPADVDYNAEAQSNPDNDIPTHIPTDGYYMKSTNANAKAAQADKVGWYVAGSFKANRIISDAEARAVIDEYNTSHQEQEPVEYDYARESGREFTPEERRISAAERMSTHRTLDRMSEELGIHINRIPRSGMPIGHHTDKGYYNPATGEMTICMDNVTDERDAIATVLHETVGHHGLRKLFGDRFNDAMARIYAALDQKGKTWVNGYIARHPNADNTRAVEEYLSHLAESGNFKNTVWDNIRRIIGRIVDALFGTNGFLLTDNELNYILRASYENLKNPNWLNTVEGRAFDTLLKRQLGINETDPNKPTDPQGPDAGRLYRDGDTGIANDDYNREVERKWNKAITENQDADRPVRIGMDKVMKEKGIKSISEDEDYVTRHNLASSRAESEAHEFELFRFTPLMDQVRAIQSRLLGKKATAADREQAYQRILDYMYAVSGLERNASKNAEIEQAKQAKLADAAAAGITDPAKLAEIEKKYDDMKRDWSGLTSLMGMSKDNWQAAETAAQGMISAFEGDIGDKAALDELWNRVRACTDFSLEHAYQHGLLTREEFERLHGTASQPRMWEYYLPLRGFSETTAEEQFSYETFTNPSRGNVVVKKMNGRWTQADNPLANILNIAETEIVQGNDNWAKQALYRFTLNAGDNTLLSASEPWFVKNPATGKWSMAFPDPGETLEEFEERMKALRALDDPLAKKGRRGLKLENIMANKAHRNEHAIHLKVGGIDKMIWVNGNPALAKAVSGIGRAQNLQWLRRASRALSNLFTTYSLDFTAKNLIRDTVYSNIALHVKEDKAYRHQYYKNWIANFGYGAFAFPMVRLAAEWDSGKLQQKEKAGALTKREQDFLNFMRDGGQTGYTIINSVNQIKKDLEKQMRSAGGRPGTVPILGWYAKAVKTLNEGFELLTRFTAYQTSRDMGRSGQRAASDAKEISVNFNRRGAQSGQGIWGNIAAYLGATHYFYNAGVQGFDNFLGLFKKKPYKMSTITAGFVIMGIATPFINSMLAGLIGGGDGDDDWYWNLPEWVRRNNLVIGTGKWYVALPLPVEFRAPYGIGDIAGAAFSYDKYPNRTFGSVAGDIITTASGILPVNPIEGYTSNGNIGDAAIRAVAPDAGMFFVDWATNRDYTGRPLWKENPFSDTVPKSQGAYASTPKGIVAACQKLAEVSNGSIDIAPGVVRDFMNNYGGGFFRAAEDVSKLLFTDEERPRRWDNVPFFSGFTGHIDEDRSNSFAQNALYDYKKLSEGNVKDMNAILNTDDVTSAVLYDEPESLYERESVTVLQKAKIKRMLDSKDYALGKMYREGMNNKYKMKQSLKDGHWYKSREIERKGVNALRQEWKDLRDQWAKMPDKTEEQKSAKAEMDLQVQEAWHLYYDAMGDLAEKLMDYEYNK